MENFEKQNSVKISMNFDRMRLTWKRFDESKVMKQIRFCFRFFGQFLTLKNMARKFFRNSNFLYNLGIKSVINHCLAATIKSEMDQNWEVELATNICNFHRKLACKEFKSLLFDEIVNRWSKNDRFYPRKVHLTVRFRYLQHAWYRV